MIWHAIKIIHEAATELDYKNGSFPDLIPDTDYDVLVAMKNDLDTLAKLAQDSREKARACRNKLSCSS